MDIILSLKSYGKKLIVGTVCTKCFIWGYTRTVSLEDLHELVRHENQS